MHYSAYSDNLMHYGVKGMKWGIRRKSRRKSKKRKIMSVASFLEKHKNAVKTGRSHIDRHHANQSFARQAMFMQQEANRAAINAGLMSMSLGASGGTNPYMFGMM